jgi:hypothetical protein
MCKVEEPVHPFPVTEKIPPPLPPAARSRNILLAWFGGSKTCYCSTEFMSERQVKVPKASKGWKIVRRMAVFLAVAAAIGFTLNHVAASLERSAHPRASRAA